MSEDDLTALDASARYAAGLNAAYGPGRASRLRGGPRPESLGIE